MKGALFEERLAQALAMPAPLLDWRDTASYGYVLDLNNQQLAWEFLRRCPEYRADFDAWYAEWLELMQSGRGDSYTDWYPVQKRMEALCDKWSLWAVHGLGVPTSAIPPEFCDTQTLRGPVPVAFSFEGVKADSSPRMDEYVPSVTIRFHLDQPIKKQIFLAEKILLKLAKKNKITLPKAVRENKHPPRNNLPRYIQLLDAKLDNRTISEIAKLLYGDTKAAYDNARDHIGAAQRLACSGYWGLYRAPQKVREKLKR